jgi:hypothetical protein
VRATRLIVFVGLLLLATRAASAQQRPLVTEDAEPIGAGRILIEGGLDYLVGQEYPVSGLEGNLWRVPTLGVSFGISSIAELQIDGGPFDHLSIRKRETGPLSHLVTATGDSTHDVEDLVVATKIRFIAEAAHHPAFAIRFATKLPNASNESGLGLDTTDFQVALLGAKTTQSIRVVGNLGLGILSDPTLGNHQNDVLTYGASVARALTDRAEVVTEINGRLSLRSGGPLPGSESRGIVAVGGRYTPGSVRFDGAMLIGVTSIGPTIGFTAGFTYVFNAFNVP